MTAALLRKITSESARVGVIGLGYVGIPLSLAAVKAGFNVVGFDIDSLKAEQLNRGESYIRHVSGRVVADAVETGRFAATSNFSQLAQMDILVICVPTPLTKYRDPDLSFVESTTREIALHLRSDQLIILESTTYPGTTEGVMRPILEQGALRSGIDFFLAFSPEREDPGNPDFGTTSIPKVVGADGAVALDLACEFYRKVVAEVVPVSSTSTAEAVKLTENIFRSVNIALVNELKTIYEAMGIDVWEVIDAAKTKPFGFMPFYPGPGLGGHCIPIDPFYLTWKAREFDISTRFIELAGEINTRMPYQVVSRLAEALDRAGSPLSTARILVLGAAYKKNVDDMRESPALKLIELIEARGASTEYHDPYVPKIPMTREHASLFGRESVSLTKENLAGYSAALVATDHDEVDYSLVFEQVPLIVDTRNAYGRRGIIHPKIVKA